MKGHHLSRAVLAAASICALGALTPAAAQSRLIGPNTPPPPSSTDHTVKVTDSIYLAVVGNQNLIVDVGNDGLLLSDDQDTPLVPRVRAQLAKISNKPVRWVVNSHWHYDHVGGNEAFAKGGALVIAQDNTRKRMQTVLYNPISDRRQAAFPASYLPKVTFKNQITLHINGDDVVLTHMPPSHTDADVVIYFKKANVIAPNDLFFMHDNYPGIEIESGASIDGMIKSYDRILHMINDKTIVVPSRGPLAKKSDVEAFRHVLVTVRARVAKMIKEGKTEAQVVAAHPTADFDPRWNREQRRADNFVKEVYYNLTHS